MNLSEVINVALTILASLGGGGLIVFGLSNWLGKVWADRLMLEETAKHESALKDLEAKHNRDLKQLELNLQASLEQTNHNYKQKIDLYKQISDPLIELIVKAENGPLTSNDLKDFDIKRLNSTALLAMFAPTEVFEQYNGVIDYMYDTVEGKHDWSFAIFRNKGLSLLNVIRKDIGLGQGEVSYSGDR